VVLFYALSADLLRCTDSLGASSGNRCIGQDPPVTAIESTTPTDRCRVILTGEIDLANAEEFLVLARARIGECQTEARFTIDLSGITFIDSTGLALLVRIRQAATDAGMDLRLAGTPPRVSQLLEITGLDGPFGLAPVRS
jgi:anti-sigma B factor antagonist